MRIKVLCDTSAQDVEENEESLQTLRREFTFTFIVLEDTFMQIGTMKQRTTQALAIEPSREEEKSGFWFHPKS